MLIYFVQTFQLIRIVGAGLKTKTHIITFLECLLYAEQRYRLFSSINSLVNVHLKLIINGNTALKLKLMPLYIRLSLNI